MAFFDKVTDKARELADSAKANVKIAEEKRRISEFQELVGNLVWKKFCDGMVFDDEITLVCEKIKASQDNINALMNEIASAKPKTIRPRIRRARRLRRTGQNVPNAARSFPMDSAIAAIAALRFPNNP